MNFELDEIYAWLVVISGITGLLIQMRISRLYLNIVHDVPIESLLSLFININTAHRDIKQVGFEQLMVSYIPFNGVIEREDRTPEKADKIKERGRLCILFFLFTFGPSLIIILLVNFGIIKSTPREETFSYLQSLSIELWG
ncbi:MAG: hypothetical protein K1X92_18115 [Bacteroidia bacterium]|nr:hypothetical protein [Bacteroidia bacterium]